MSKKSEFLDQVGLKPTRFELHGKTTLITTKEGRFLIKEKNHGLDSIYSYLKSREFYGYLLPLEENERYELLPYIEEVEMPKEQKLSDMVELMSLLHSKTVHMVEQKEEDVKAFYEDIQNNLLYLTSYYEDTISLFEQTIIMSPSEYLFCRNSSSIFYLLSYAKEMLERWYQMVKEKKEKRQVLLHNDLSFEHFLRGEKSYFTHFEHAKFDSPIFDFYKLYKKYIEDYDFSFLLRFYEKKFPLTKEEKTFLFLLLSIPDKISFQGTEYEKCVRLTHFIEKIEKTIAFLPKDTKEGEYEKQKQQKQ